MQVACLRRDRLRGLALRRAPPSEPLLIPGCRSVHTFGMRFALDLFWLDGDGDLVRVDRAVPPRRIRSCRGAWAVLEAPHGIMRAVTPRSDTRPEPHEDSRPDMPPDEVRGRTRAALDPRQPLQRDRFNEYFVFSLSATGAAVIAPLLLYIVMAFTGLWTWFTFAIAAVLVELILIFVIARPQMQRHEAVGWALLWSFTTAVLALCFFWLVASSTL
jgi:uncharacterized membrane protein (UPF0127 family)